jgi:hypothetical protein
MHEIGHSLGFGHSNSSNANFLMESFSQTNFDGPQFDDIRGVHYLYGDFNEKSNSGVGNESITTATPLGPLASGQSVTIGEHARTGTLILSSESDFVSIAMNDLDFYSFTIDGPSLVDLTLSPLGPNDSPIHGRGDGVAGIDGDDFLVWKSHFGESFGTVRSSSRPYPAPPATRTHPA